MRTLIEAAAMELPIITTDVQGRDVVDHGSLVFLSLQDGSIKLLFVCSLKP